MKTILSIFLMIGMTSSAFTSDNDCASCGSTLTVKEVKLTEKTIELARLTGDLKEGIGRTIASENGVSPDTQELLCGLAENGDIKAFNANIDSLKSQVSKSFNSLQDSYSLITCFGGQTLLQRAISNRKTKFAGTLILKYKIPLNTLNKDKETELDFLLREDEEVKGGGNSTYGSLIKFLRNSKKVKYEKALFTCEIEEKCKCDDDFSILENACSPIISS